MQLMFYMPCKRLYFLVVTPDDTAHCSRCGRLIEAGGSILFHQSWTYRSHLREMRCQDCLSDIKKFFIDEMLNAFVTEVIPLNSVLFDESPPALTPGIPMCGDAPGVMDTERILRDNPQAAIIDNTKLSGRLSWDGCVIGLPIPEKKPLLEGKP